MGATRTGKVVYRPNSAEVRVKVIHSAVGAINERLPKGPMVIAGFVGMGTTLVLAGFVGLYGGFFVPGDVIKADPTDDLAHVVAEPTQGLDPVGRDDLAASPDAGRTADDAPVGDVRAGDVHELAVTLLASVDVGKRRLAADGLGERLGREELESGAPGAYALMAAINSIHTSTADVRDTDDLRQHGLQP